MAEHETKGDGQVGANGAIVHHVLVESGDYAGRRLTFTQHSPDRYTVFGMSVLPSKGISIERRTENDVNVLMHDSSAVHTLRDEDQWIAHCVIAESYYGVLAVGTSAEDAYAKAFHRFSG